MIVTLTQHVTFPIFKLCRTCSRPDSTISAQPLPGSTVALCGRPGRYLAYSTFLVHSRRSHGPAGRTSRFLQQPPNDGARNNECVTHCEETMDVPRPVTAAPPSPGITGTDRPRPIRDPRIICGTTLAGACGSGVARLCCPSRLCRAGRASLTRGGYSQAFRIGSCLPEEHELHREGSYRSPTPLSPSLSLSLSLSPSLYVRSPRD